MKLKPLGVSSSTLTHALGDGVDLLWQSVIAKESGLKKNHLDWCDLQTWIGASPIVDQVRLTDDLEEWDCRNNRLAWLALQNLIFRDSVDLQIRKFGSNRVGLVLGTSTSGIRSTEIAYSERIKQGKWPEKFAFHKTHTVDALCDFVIKVLGIQGPSVGIATACASSAKVFLTAQRWISAGLVDAVVVGGVDSLCLSTLHGFDSLQLLSSDVCRPFDLRRKGISIGEAAGFVLLTKELASVQFLGGGESSDAWHITSPHPDGLGAQAAIQSALSCSDLCPSDINYINAHGTATPSNDKAEAAAINSVFRMCDVAVSSTKGVTGHTLGAAGIVEAIITIEAINNQILPPLTTLKIQDPDFNFNLIREATAAQIKYAMSNNFGFGGMNCSLIFGQGNV